MSQTQFPADIEVVDIDSVQPLESNSREHDVDNVAAIRSSLRQYKQQIPIVVDADGKILKGNGTWHAAKAEGWSEIAVVRSALGGVEREAYSIADNRASDLSRFDESRLRLQVEMINQEDPDLLQFLGFDDVQISQYIELPTDLDDAGDDQVFGEFEGDDDALPAAAADGFVIFRFGEHRGQISRDVYELFVAEFERQQQETGEPMLNDVLKVWLCLTPTEVAESSASD